MHQSSCFMPHRFRMLLSGLPATLTFSTEVNPYWKIDSPSGGSDIFHILRNPKIAKFRRGNLYSLYFFRFFQFTPVHYFFNTSFNIILQFVYKMTFDVVCDGYFWDVWGFLWSKFYVGRIIVLCFLMQPKQRKRVCMCMYIYSRLEGSESFL